MTISECLGIFFYCLEESMDIFRQYYGVMIYKPLYRVCLTFLKCSNNWCFCYVLKLYNVAADALWKETSYLRSGFGEL